MPPELFAIIVVEAFDGCVLDSAVHPLDLSVGPGMIGLGEPVLDTVFSADAVEDVLQSVAVPLAIGELYAVVGERGVDGVGNGCDEVTQELSGGHFPGFCDQLSEGELRGSVDGHEEVEFALGGA